MPVKPLNLDDRTFVDLVGEERLLIPRYARPWTDHNVSDPGIMLIELFAWLTEALLYRINRVPDPSRLRLLELLGASFRPAEPAVLELRVTWHGDGERCTLPRGARVRADRGSARPVFFEVLHDVTFSSLQPERTVTARQTVRIDSKELPQVSDGQPLPLFPLSDGFFAAPPGRRQRRPQVLVAGEPWEYRPYLRESQGTDTHFTFKPWLESIAFGDGQKGAIPPAGALIEISYHSTPTKPGVVKEQFQSGGQPWQTYRLSQPLQLLDLEEPSDLEPRLEVVEPNTQGLSAPWKFVARFLDMAENAPQYVVEPWHNAIRFGNGTHGKVPTAGSKIKIAYHQTSGAAGNIPPTSSFSFWSNPRAEMDANEESWTRVENLEAEDWEILSPGRDATSLDEARNQVFALLEPGWRAVTDGDFVSVVQQNHPDVARVVCLPGYDPADPMAGADRPGHVGVIVIPRATSDLNVSATELYPAPGLTVDDLRLVTGDADGATWLWGVKTGQEIARLADQPPHRLVFGPDGLRAVVIPQDGAAWLWDTRRGRKLVALESSALSDPDAGEKSEKHTQASSGQPSLSHAAFSPDGRRLATVAADAAAVLWESNDGGLLTELGVVDPATPPVFNSDGRLLATAHRDNTIALWGAEVDRPLAKFRLDAPATQMRFSPDGARLAIATADANVRLTHIRPADSSVHEELTLNPGYSVKPLVFDPSGMRLATHGHDGDATLWSSRTGARMAELSHLGSVDQLVFSADGRWLATAHRDHTVRCWNARDGREVFSLSNTTPVHAMVFSPSGHRLAIVGAPAQQTPTLQAWDLRGDTARLVATHDLAESQPVVVNESGQWLAYTDERLVHVWDVERSKDISAIYVDFREPGVEVNGWRLVTLDDDIRSAADAQHAPVRLTRGPYLWVASAAGTGTARRTVQVLNAEHVYQVDTQLGTRKLVTSQHHVEGPTYAEVEVSVKVTRRTLVTSQQTVTTDISKALSRFFDPLHGGPEGTGWPLGRPVYASEVYEVVEGVAAVDHVEELALKPISAGHQGRVDIPPRSLVKCTIHAEVE